MIAARNRRRVAMERAYCAQDTDCLRRAIAARRVEGMQVCGEDTRGLEGHDVVSF